MFNVCHMCFNTSFPLLFRLFVNVCYLGLSYSCVYLVYNSICFPCVIHACYFIDVCYFPQLNPLSIDSTFGRSRGPGWSSGMRAAFNRPRVGSICDILAWTHRGQFGTTEVAGCLGGTARCYVAAVKSTCQTLVGCSWARGCCARDPNI